MDFKEIQQEICNTVQNGVQKNVQNSELVKTINTCGGYLNAKTISAWAKEKGIDYTTAKYRINRDKIQLFELFGTTFIIDNE